MESNAHIHAKQGVIWLPGDPLLDNTAVTDRLFKSVSTQEAPSEVHLPRKSGEGANHCNLIIADRVSEGLVIWEFIQPHFHDWTVTEFPCPTVAVIIPVFDPRTWVHLGLAMTGTKPRPEIKQNIDKLAESQRTHIQSCTAPILAYLDTPILLIYLRETQIPFSNEYLVGAALAPICYFLNYQIGEVDTFRDDFSDFLEHI